MCMRRGGDLPDAVGGGRIQRGDPGSPLATQMKWDPRHHAVLSFRGGKPRALNFRRLKRLSHLVSKGQCLAAKCTDKNVWPEFPKKKKAH